MAGVFFCPRALTLIATHCYTSRVTTTKIVAQAVGIAPRTKKFVLTDQWDMPYAGNRNTNVLAALCRSDKTPDLDRRTRTIANAVFKSLTTGRMNSSLAMRILVDYSPYQVCGVVAKISEKFEGEPTIGELADFWINAYAAEL